jgi:hypothetical protein
MGQIPHIHMGHCNHHEYRRGRVKIVSCGAVEPEWIAQRQEVAGRRRRAS